MSRFPWKHTLWGNHTHADVPFSTTESPCRIILCSFVFDIRSIYVLNVKQFVLRPSYQSKQENLSDSISKRCRIVEKILIMQGFPLPWGRKPGGKQGVESPLPTTGLPHQPPHDRCHKEAPQCIHTSPDAYPSINMRHKDLSCLFDTTGPVSRRRRSHKRPSEGKDMNFKTASRATLPPKKSQESQEVKFKCSVKVTRRSSQLSTARCHPCFMFSFFQTSCAGAWWWLTC